MLHVWVAIYLMQLHLVRITILCPFKRYMLNSTVSLGRMCALHTPQNLLENYVGCMELYIINYYKFID